MKKICLMVLALIVLNSCTKNFEEINTNPNQITDKMLEQDFNLVGSSFSVMLFNLMGHQIEEDLCYDNWMGYMGSPTPYVAGVNNTTYYLRWIDAYWNRIYGSVMSPSKQVIQLAEEKTYHYLAIGQNWLEY
ncbi:SusD/RagB family nutrient-binding outer membrane lipoprotein [Pedobacter steynii]